MLIIASSVLKAVVFLGPIRSCYLGSTHDYSVCC